MAYRNLSQDIRKVRAGDLLPNLKNWRQHPPRQVAAMRGILNDVGFVGALIARETPDGLMLIDGHLREELVPDMEVPVIVVPPDITDEQADKLLALYDPLGDMIETGGQKLQDLLGGISTANEGLQVLLDDVRQRAQDAMPKREGAGGDEFNTGKALEAPCYVERGQVWLCGDHRVMCGDSCTREDVTVLVGSRRAATMFTDPPYGVVFGSAKKNAISGDLTQAAIPIGLAVALEEALDADARLYVCGGSGNWEMYARLFEHHLQQQVHPIVWVKESFVMRPNNYHSQFELVYFGWKGKGGSPKFWYGDRKQSDVWNEARDHNHLHPTEKPIELPSRAIGNSCPPSGAVYDPFHGSGTTLIAAERLGRRCYGMEISEKYVQVALARYEAETGGQAVMEGANDRS